MMRNLILYILLNTSVIIGMIPSDLQERIAALHLENVQVSFLEEAYCAAIIGIEAEEKKAFVALRYLALSGLMEWTHFAQVPFDQDNDVFALFCQGGKILTIQSSSEQHHTNAIGYQIYFNPLTATLTIELVDPSRFFLERPDTILLFSQQ